MVFADLHMHTTASDGTSTVRERVSQATARDLGAIAITDHDCITSELETRVTVREGVEVVTGVEIRADLFDTKVELLGYFVDPTDETVQSMLDEAREFRRTRNVELVERLADATGMDLDYGDLSAAVDGELGRPHLADLLIDAGYVDSVGEAFDEYLAPGGRAYVPMERLPYRRVVETIAQAGGLSSLAHPGRIRSDNVPEMVATLADAGLDAIEVGYPYDGPRSGVGVDEAARLADEYDLLRTGGSDCHGPESGKFRIGETGLAADVYDRLRSAAAVSPLDGQA